MPRSASTPALDRAPVGISTWRDVIVSPAAGSAGTSPARWCNLDVLRMPRLGLHFLHRLAALDEARRRRAVKASQLRNAKAWPVRRPAFMIAAGCRRKLGLGAHTPRMSNNCRESTAVRRPQRLITASHSRRILRSSCARGQAEQSRTSPCSSPTMFTQPPRRLFGGDNSLAAISRTGVHGAKTVICLVAARAASPKVTVSQRVPEKVGLAA